MPTPNNPAADPTQLATHIDTVLAEVHTHAGPNARDAVETLIRDIMTFYGTGLTHIVDTIHAATGPDLIHRLAADPLISAQLALHDLHPVELTTRLRHALNNAKQRLGTHATDITLTGVDGNGKVRIQIPPGCGTDTIRDIIETAITELAPDTEGIQFDTTPPTPPLLQIHTRPPARSTP